MSALDKRTVESEEGREPTTIDWVFMAVALRSCSAVRAAWLYSERSVSSPKKVSCLTSTRVVTEPDD